MFIKRDDIGTAEVHLLRRFEHAHMDCKKDLWLLVYGTKYVGFWPAALEYPESEIWCETTPMNKVID